MKRNIFQHVARGCGYLPVCGHHPGTLPMLLFVAIGTVAGGFGGAGLMLALVLPIYLYGAYSRSVFDDQVREETNE